MCLGLLAIYVAGDWALPLIDRDEPRFAEASREMLQRRDFIVPFFNNQPRYDKPPLIYWLQDAAYKCLGENELAARLPSGLCAALAAAIVALWGAQLYGAAAGWRAALLFGLCLQTILHAHAAVADMAMIAASTASAWAGWNWLTRAGPARLRWGLAFWALLALGFLAKGPIAWVPIGMALWAAARIEPGKRPGAAAWLGGILLMLSLVAIWGVPALIRTHGAFAAVGLGKHVVMRSVAPLEGHGAKSWTAYAVTFPYYFATVWVSFFPGSIWLPGALRAGWAARRAWGLAEQYLAAGIVLVFAIFTLSWTKLPHYTLPAFPWIALLVAHWSAGALARLPRAAAASATVALALCLAGFPAARRWFASRQLYEAAAPWLSRPMEMATISYHEPSLVWLFRGSIDGFETSINWKDAEHWLARPGPRLCVMTEADLPRCFRRMDPEWRVARADGFDVADGRREHLVAVIKTQ